MPRRVLIAVLTAAVAATLVACGSKGNEVPQDGTAVARGSQLFADRCAGCHTFEVVGTSGSSEKVRDQERVDGPSFDTRPETVENVLYAIQNGGFSGSIMPQNIVVGDEARAVAEFVAKYAGK